MMINHLAIDLRNRVDMARAATRDERGAAMAEYGLLLALVALAAIAILALFGGEIVEVFTEAEEAIDQRDSIPAAD